MEENGQFCVGCMCAKDAFSLEEFTIQCEPLKAICQVDRISLCYLCKRIAQHTELFIQNVQSNQILLETFHKDLSSILLHSQVKPSITLTTTQLPTIELTETSADDEVVFSIISSKELKIKLELKEEGLENLEGDHLEGEFIDDDIDFQDSYVKEEDDVPLKSLLMKKIELGLDGVDLKTAHTTLKCKKGTNKLKDRIKKKLIETPKKYITMHITKTQCKKERENRAQRKAYLNSRYKCEGCVKGFMVQEAYDRHMAKHSLSRGKFQCPICSMRYDTATKLAHHKQRHTLRYKCPECETTCAGFVTIKEHMSTKHSLNNGYSELKCPHCPKVFTRAVSLRKHRYYRHSGKVKVTCEICHCTYANKDSLRAHLLRKHPGSVPGGAHAHAHECAECGLAFHAPSQLRNHRVKHSDHRAFYCVECDRSFKTAAILTHHLKTTTAHIKYSELPLPCQQCEKRFAIKRDLVRHTNRVHLNIKPYSCDKCDKKYINSWSLREHKRYTHDGAKRPLRYPCSMCDKVFDRNSILKSHTRTHTGERPYRCARCPAAFAQPSARATHTRLVHLKLTRQGRPRPDAQHAAC